MMNFKDNFSQQAEIYARYRPTYPQDLFDFLMQEVKNKDLAWDCATGNGQVAFALSKYFKQIIATDASESQIKQAKQTSNVTYRVATAENSYLESQSIDLITVGQALHWFDFNKFYTEVRRVAKADALIAIWGYGLMQVDAQIDEIILHLYHQILGDAYWDAERKYLDNHYQTIPFPFTTIETPQFTMQLDWDFGDLLGYLNTWSSVQKYLKNNHSNPIDLVEQDLRNSWQNVRIKKTITWDLYLKLGKINSNNIL